MNSKEIVVYKCSECGMYFLRKEDADKCCSNSTKLCEDCGVEIPKNHYYVVCDDCKGKREAKTELERYNKATKYTFESVPKESIEYMFNELYPFNDGYMYDADDVEEYGIKYVYGTKRVSPTYDAQDMIEYMLEDSFEDAMSNVSDEETDRLQFAIDTFIKKHDGCLDHFEVDYHTVIDLDKGDK